MLQDLCTIITPFGKYKYKQLPTGIKCAPEIPTEVMVHIFGEMEPVSVFFDDIGVFDTCSDQHLKTLDEVLMQLQENVFCVNPLKKCKWCVKETDYFGYWVMPTGLRPWKKKIDAILCMGHSKTVTEL